MNKVELLGFLLQDLRDDRTSDEEDLHLALCRETSKIFELIIRHGHLTREMFDPSGISDRSRDDTDDGRYEEYQTTNYPISYVAFADSFSEWLLDTRSGDRLEILDLIGLIKEFSSFRIKIVPRDGGSLVVVRNWNHSGYNVNKRVFIKH